VTALLDRPLVINEKLDGSNLCMTAHKILARTHAHAAGHPSFDMAKRVWAELRSRIPPGISIFGEWLFARHSIQYRALPGYFVVFGVRDDASGAWWSWDGTVQQARILDLPTAPLLWSGQVHGELELRGQVARIMAQPSSFVGAREGVVVRLAGPMTDFGVSIAQWVRAGHVTTEDHWSSQPIVRNGLARSAAEPRA
jgi:hypothetical protein